MILFLESRGAATPIVAPRSGPPFQGSRPARRLVPWACAPGYSLVAPSVLGFLRSGLPPVRANEPGLVRFLVTSLRFFRGRWGAHSVGSNRRLRAVRLTPDALANGRTQFRTASACRSFSGSWVELPGGPWHRHDRAAGERAGQPRHTPMRSRNFGGSPTAGALPCRTRVHKRTCPAL